MAAIAKLFLGCSPAAIVWRIRAVVVDAVERHSSGRFAHISKEILKNLPSFANRYAATSPIFESSMLRIETSLPHCVPAAVSRRIFIGMPMFEMKFAAITATANSFPTSQICAVNGGLGSAVAATEPLRFIVHVREADDCPATKPLASDIFESGHGDLLERLLRLGAASVSALSRPTLIAQMVL